MWPNRLLLELHAIYVYVEFSGNEKDDLLKEIIFLVGVGLVETAYFRYVAVLDQLYAIPSTMHKNIGLVYELFAKA